MLIQNRLTKYPRTYIANRFCYYHKCRQSVNLIYKFMKIYNVAKHNSIYQQYALKKILPQVLMNYSNSDMKKFNNGFPQRSILSASLLLNHSLYSSSSIKTFLKF